MSIYFVVKIGKIMKKPMGYVPVGRLAREYLKFELVLCSNYNLNIIL